MALRHSQEDIRVLRNVVVDDGKKVQSNIFDANGNSDVEFQRIGSTYLTLKTDRIEASKQLAILTTGVQAKFEHSAGNYFLFNGGNAIDTYATGGAPQRININYYSKGDLMIGNGSDPSDCSINKFPVAGKALSVAGLINTDTGIETDAIDTTGDTNLVVKQNGGAILTYDVGDATYPDGIFNFDKDVSINTGKYVQCNTIKAHIFDTHDSLEPNDVSFRYNGTTYMFYDQSLSNFQVRTDIASNQDITCVALTETSDRRLKEDIDDFHSNCIELIKKINVKKYKFKDDKKNKTNIGFIADDVLENAPSDIENIVDTDKDYLSMNYGRMCCLLWKCCQEQQSKIEHLEASVYELQEALKDYIKPKPKSKAKAKAKTEK